MSNTGFLLFVYAVAVIIATVPAACSISTDVERNRIYQKCLQNNLKETYENATNTCKEFVKNDKEKQ
jgi:hypothetical protein